MALQNPELAAAFQLLQMTWNKDYQVSIDPNMDGLLSMNGPDDDLCIVKL